MTEEETEQVSEQGEDASESADGTEAEKDFGPPEKVTDLDQSGDTEGGTATADELDRLKPVCTNAEQKYQQVSSLIKEIKEAEGVLKRFHARQDKLTPLDVDKAKEKFTQAKEAYLQAGNEINEGIKEVHTLAKAYPTDIISQNLYKTYLAKLLSSLETRNPVEKFVESMALSDFSFDEIKIELTEDETQREITEDSKKQEMLDETHKLVNMLESRYLKRQLQNKMRLGENQENIIKRLSDILQRDPTDLHTYIWIARLMLEEYEKERNQNTRVTVRDEILNYCQKAFSLIDDFLTLQGIENLSDRDKRRAGYVKTISLIRKPLLSKGD